MGPRTSSKVDHDPFALDILVQIQTVALVQGQRPKSYTALDKRASTVMPV